MNYLSSWSYPYSPYSPYSVTEDTNVSHADGIRRHMLMPYDVHTLQYKYDYTILSGFQSQCKRMLDLKLFNVVQMLWLMLLQALYERMCMMPLNWLPCYEIQKSLWHYYYYYYPMDTTILFLSQKAPQKYA